MYSLQKNRDEVLICDGACVVGDVTLGRGVSVWYNAVLRGDKGPIVVGENTNIQDCAVLHGCTVGDNTLIGMGAVILDGAKIGNDCIVGAGALVTGKMDAPDGSMVLGSPAKVVRPLTEQEIQSIRESMEGYLALAQRCRQGE